MKYMIYDTVSTPQRFDLKKLMNEVQKKIRGKDFQIRVNRCRGYGCTICKWEDILEEQDYMIPENEEMARLIEGGEEWFYDIDIEVITDAERIEFGIEDSSFMYISASNDHVKEFISEYNKVKRVD